MKTAHTSLEFLLPIPPGESIKEEMEYFGMTQKELAERLGLSAKHVSDILSGEAPITRDCAFRLSIVFNSSMEFWMNLETNYQVLKTRQEKEAFFNKSLEVLDFFKESLKVIKDRADEFYTNPQNDSEKVSMLCHFFGVSHLQNVFNIERIAYRKRDDVDKASIATWLRLGELKLKNAEEIPEFNTKKLKESSTAIRNLINKGDYKENLDEIKKLLNEAGVYFEYEEKVPRAKVVGATRWRKYRPFIQMSDFGQFQDIFWFTLFHEIGHALLHGKKDFSLKEGDGDNSENFEFTPNIDDPKKEDEADFFAQTTLIPEDAWNEFCQLTNANKKPPKYNAIKEFSEKINTSSKIIAGRLANDFGYWSQMGVFRK